MSSIPPWAKDKQKFRKLQLRWYDKIRKDGFRDIEGHSDMNDFPVSTMRSSRSPGESVSGTHLSWNFNADDEHGYSSLEGWDGQSGLGESGNYEYYSRIQDHIRNLPAEDKVRRVCQAFLAKHPNQARHEVKGVSARNCMSIWSETIKLLGLPPERRSGTYRDKPKPGKVRRLSKKEIKQLGYKAPKDIDE